MGLFPFIIYLSIPVCTAVVVGFFIKSKRKVPICIFVFAVVFMMQYSLALYMNRHPRVQYNEEYISEDEAGKLTEFLSEEYKVTLTNGNKFWIPIGFSLGSESNGYYSYFVEVFPIGEYRWFVSSEELS